MSVRQSPHGAAGDPHRWEILFADLEAQLAAEERRDVEAEVADRTRRERALIPFADRLTASIGHSLAFHLVSGQVREGRLGDVGADWVLVIASGGAARSALLPLEAIAGVRGASSRARQDRTARRFGLGSALRVLSRDRASVLVTDVSGATTSGTIDSVGADCFDLAEHPVGVARRSAEVRAARLVPFRAVVTVSAADPTSLLG